MKPNELHHNNMLRVVGIGGTLRKPSSSLFALKEALRAAEMAGATTELLDLRELNLPMFQPGKALEDYGANVAHFINASQQAQAMIWSTAAYHGSLAGVTKNAIDFFQLLHGDDNPYLLNKVIGLIATAGGDMAAVNAANAMVHSVHSLRGTTIPLLVTIPQTWKAIDLKGGTIDSKWQERLEQLGQLVVETANSFQANNQLFAI